MGRFSPTVLPSGLNPFAEALQAGAGSYLQARDRRITEERQSAADKRAEETHGWQRAREELARRQAALEFYRQGGRSGAAPTEEMPVVQLPDAGAVPALSFPTQIGGDARAAGPLGVDAQRALVAPRAAGTLAISRAPSRYEQIDPEHYLDTWETPEAQGERRQQAQFDSQLERLRLQQEEMNNRLLLQLEAQRQIAELNAGSREKVAGIGGTSRVQSAQIRANASGHTQSSVQGRENVRAAQAAVDDAQQAIRLHYLTKPRRADFQDQYGFVTDTSALNEGMRDWTGGLTDLQGQLLNRLFSRDSTVRSVTSPQLPALTRDQWTPGGAIAPGASVPAQAPASSAAAPQPTAPAAPPVTPQAKAAFSAAAAKLTQQYQSALADDVDPDEARRLYDQQMAALARKHGMMP